MTTSRIAAAAAGVLSIACLTAASGPNDPGADKTRAATATGLSERTSASSVQPLSAHALRVARAKLLVRQGKRRKPGTVYRANSRTVCTVYLLKRKCVHRLSRGAKARKAARITRHKRYLAAKYRRHQRYLLEKRNGAYVVQVYQRMQAIDNARLPYLYGGGHGGLTPFLTPMDCSASVSRALNVPVRVSGAFESIGRPGEGRISVYANSGHVFMSIVINGERRYWGTSMQNPGGGPGWINARMPYGFVTRHVA